MDELKNAQARAAEEVLGLDVHGGMNRFTELVLALGSATLGLFVVAGIVACAWLHGVEGRSTCGNKVPADLMAISSALDDFAMQHEMRYPNSLVELLVHDLNGHRYLDLKSLPQDPWGRAYRYVPPAAGGRPRLFTLGADGQPGGEGEEKDFDLETWLSASE